MRQILAVDTDATCAFFVVDHFIKVKVVSLYLHSFDDTWLRVHQHGSRHELAIFPFLKEHIWITSWFQTGAVKTVFMRVEGPELLGNLDAALTNVDVD